MQLRPPWSERTGERKRARESDGRVELGGRKINVGVGNETDDGLIETGAKSPRRGEARKESDPNQSQSPNPKPNPRHLCFTSLALFSNPCHSSGSLLG